MFTFTYPTALSHAACGRAEYPLKLTDLSLTGNIANRVPPKR